MVLPVIKKYLLSFFLRETFSNGIEMLICNLYLDMGIGDYILIPLRFFSPTGDYVINICFRIVFCHFDDFTLC